MGCSVACLQWDGAACIPHAESRLKRSTVVGAGGQSVVDTYRTSYGMFIKRHHDPVISTLEERVALWTKYNVSHQEDIQVLRYGFSQEYRSHYDSLDEDSPRTATVLIYLSDVEEGGETTFPNSEWLSPGMNEKHGPFSPCADGHVSMKPKRGDAIVFHSQRPDGKTLDPHSLHTACPVIKGIKYVAIFWVHTKPFRPEELGRRQPPEPPVNPDECEDTDENCENWAQAGECDKNPQFMKGSATGLGTCRRSCGECTVCAEGDAACRRENRLRAGFLPIHDPDFF
ncbi:hypothetical protein COHA_002272 [Chlorella ohadii]|uniref:Fe2OG dioxygenase domain-containing protein n=1 Tax=Chlorella ohadii TaxID=2649997 RepID=A0AAD5DUY9_9CHLO|nr:hypothetical protein COHA_002272 [Chlorella ohadii]